MSAMPFCRAMATPSVPISVISTSRPRKGAMTVRSSAKPTRHAPIAPASSAMPNPSAGHWVAGRSPANMPTMKMSGCAKLMTRSTVKASAKPIATTA